MIEHRAGAEFRVAGRTLSGTVLRYGDLSPEHRERFAPGAFAPVPMVRRRPERAGGRSILLVGLVGDCLAMIHQSVERLGIIEK